MYGFNLNMSGKTRQYVFFFICLRKAHEKMNYLLPRNKKCHSKENILHFETFDIVVHV